MQTFRETARGVILRGGKLLLIRRTRQNDHGGVTTWLSIPGGGVERGETPQRAVIRELEEELGVTVAICSLLAVQEVPADASRHNYFLCTILAGKPQILEQSEEYRRMQSEVGNTYAIEWTDFDSPNLTDKLFWAYGEAFRYFKPLIGTEVDEPLLLLTTGDSLAPATKIYKL